MASTPGDTPGKLPPAAPSLRSLSAITLFVEDLIATRDFYTTVFAAPVVFQDDVSCAFKFDNIIVNLLLAAEGASLVSPTTAGGADAPCRFQISIWVQDLDPVLENLVARGVSPIQGPTLQPWGMRTLTFTDPAGHCWEVGQRVGK